MARAHRKTVRGGETRNASYGVSVNFLHYVVVVAKNATPVTVGAN